ncbi:MgtC/SapB family protein [Pontibacillus salicampi]|uniref:MgtC/SapB family protein n=1 Tax=Pontibacillus salicampi TaxID=1449801 RepID=A0ABV6LTL3_9BACI
MTTRLITAVLLCGLIGFEREIKNRSAGFRTHILVGVGACLMMLLSLYGFEPFLDEHETIRFDPARIPSYVISGIGFLGAGTIIVNGLTIRGLTTAASIWTVAGLGLVIGAGMYGPAILATIVVLVSLIVLNNVERLFVKRSSLLLYIQVKDELNMTDLVAILEQHNASLSSLTISREQTRQRAVYVELLTKGNNNEMTLFDEISHLPSVTYVSRGSK